MAEPRERHRRSARDRRVARRDRPRERRGLRRQRRGLCCRPRRSLDRDRGPARAAPEPALPRLPRRLSVFRGRLRLSRRGQRRPSGRHRPERGARRGDPRQGPGRGHRLRLRRPAVRAPAAAHRARGHRCPHRRDRRPRRRPSARSRPLSGAPRLDRRRSRRLPRRRLSRSDFPPCAPPRSRVPRERAAAPPPLAAASPAARFVASATLAGFTGRFEAIVSELETPAGVGWHARPTFTFCVLIFRRGYRRRGRCASARSALNAGRGRGYRSSGCRSRSSRCP